MLKIDTEENNVQIGHRGDPLTLAAEFAQVAGVIYNAIKTKHEFAAEIFQMSIREALKEDSRVWEPIEGVLITIKKSDAPTDQS